MNHAVEIKILAERKMGEILASAPKNQGALPGKTGARAAPVLDQTPTLADIGITKKESARAQKLAAIPEPELRDRIAVAKASGAHDRR